MKDIGYVCLEHQYCVLLNQLGVALITAVFHVVCLQEAETKAIIPTEYMGVKLVSFGFAGQTSAIMRGPMVSGVINQLLTTTEWGQLDYLVIDMPPGTGDIQLTLCQVILLKVSFKWWKCN
jgi:Mrp family chromosome partitioning ATPase